MPAMLADSFYRKHVDGRDVRLAVVRIAEYRDAAFSGRRSRVRSAAVAPVVMDCLGAADD